MLATTVDIGLNLPPLKGLFFPTLSVLLQAVGYITDLFLVLKKNLLV